MLIQHKPPACRTLWNQLVANTGSPRGCLESENCFQNVGVETVARGFGRRGFFNRTCRNIERCIIEIRLVLPKLLLRKLPISPWQKSSRHSTVPASRRTALRLGHILPVCFLIAPCPAGAGTVSVLARLSPRTAIGRLTKKRRLNVENRRAGVQSSDREVDACLKPFGLPALPAALAGDDQTGGSFPHL